MSNVWGLDELRASQPYKITPLLFDLLFVFSKDVKISHSNYFSWRVLLWGKCRGWMVVYPFLPLGPVTVADIIKLAMLISLLAYKRSYPYTEA